MRNSSPVALGQVIANKFQVEGVIGEGGMGVVVSAWHLGLEQRVAIKLLLSHMRTADGSAIERFQREARAAARIRSEHVCRVIDTGSLEDGTPFLVMEYLDGADLADELLRRGRFTVSEAVLFVRQACLALAEAHQAGVIHRDLKPANLFLIRNSDGSSCIKVLDFGVSKSLSRSGVPNMTLTRTSAVVGSPIYMSPEQLNSSKDVDGRTDIWALGTILYEFITGRTPFYGETIPQLVNAVLNTEPESFASLGIEAPDGLEDVIVRALAKKRDQRIGSARELFAALAPFVGETGSIVGTLPAISPHSETMAVSRPPSQGSGERQRPSDMPSSSGLGPRSGSQSNEVGAHGYDRQSKQRVEPWSESRSTPPDKRVRWVGLVALMVAAAGVAAYLSRTPKQALGDRASERTPPAVGTRERTPPAVAATPSAAARPEPSATTEAEPSAAVTPVSATSDAAAALPLGADTPQRPLSGEAKRGKEKPRAGSKEPAQPATPAAHPDSNDDGLSNFGGRR